MYRISELAERVGLSRSTLLYYEKQGLIQGQRQENGYRIYSQTDLERLRLLQQLHAAGLSLKESLACLEARLDRQLLLDRLQRLDDEIAQKQKARQLLSGLLGQADLRGWHQMIEDTAPEAHFEWLLKQGFTEKEALRLKWLSKDMNQHEHYMADFSRLFDGISRLGPGGSHEVRKALAHLPFKPGSLLEIGCGKGISTLELASHLACQIVATDNDDASLDVLRERVKQQGLAAQVTVQSASMTELPFPDASFDVIWAEGCAYIMGFDQALRQWRRLLLDDGVMVVSDLVRLIPESDMKSVDFWKAEYPDMSSKAERSKQIEEAGYDLLDSFEFGDDAWWSYYTPLEERIKQLAPDMFGSQALRDMETEIAIRRNHGNEYGYVMFILKKKDEAK